MPLTSGQLINNRYRIVKLLGQGGFGAVYRAWDTNLDEPVALKESFETSPAAQKQFQLEAKLLFKLRHANLPRVHDFFVIAGQGMYLVMDYIEGEDLRTMLQQSGRPLLEAQVLEWAVQVCDALEYLHSQKPPIIHRDIKPANIKITPEGKAMLVDFGIAKILDELQSTTGGARAVTPGYSPPEQYGRGSTDAQSDVYALGATCYHLLTGQLPPDSVNILSSMEPAPPSVHLLNPQVTLQTSVAIDRAMQPNRLLRWQNVAEFKAALTAASAGEKIEYVTRPASITSSAAFPPVPVTRVNPPVSAPPTAQVPPHTGSSLFIAGFLVLFALVILCGIGAFFFYRWRLAEQTSLQNQETFVSMLATGVVSETPRSSKAIAPTIPPTSIPTAVPSPTFVWPTFSPAPPPTLTALPTRRPSPTPVVSQISPEQIIRVYYNAINQRNYDQAWSILSDDFKNKYNSTGYGPYVNWWDTVEEMEILQLEIREKQGPSSAVIFSKLRYHYKDRRVVDDSYLFTVIAWSWQYGWLIDSYR